MMLLGSVFVVTVFITVIFIIYDFIPFFWPFFKRKFFTTKKDFTAFETKKEAILKVSLEAIKSRKSKMIWKEPGSISERFFNAIIYALGPKYKNLNFPRAFLFQGLSQYLIAQDENSVLKNEFDKLLTVEGKPNFDLNIVDQVPLGIAALNLESEYLETKYLAFSDAVYKLIENNYDKNGLVFYRDKQEIIYYDTIGMIVPFLVKYYNHTKNEKAITIAKNQIQFYLDYGIDRITGMPSHAIHLETKVKVGSINWGRGIGWYFLGLKAIVDFDGSFSEEYNLLSKNILKLKNSRGLWSQFPGSSNETDTSATLMILYCLPLDILEIEGYLPLLNEFVNKRGFIGHTSGDTYGANRYSYSFGESELAQGMLLLLLSKKHI